MPVAPPASRRLRAQVWSSDAYPERSLPELQGRLDAGVCLSGGGTRALVAAVGQLGALHQLGLLDRIGYVSGVSGGSWAAGPTTYAPRPLEELLGAPVAPAACTLEALARPPASTLALTATRSLRAALFDRLRQGPARRMWEDAIGSLYYAPFGLSSEASFTWSEGTRAAILARNPSLAPSALMIPPPGRPYLVVNATLVGPTRLAPFSREQVVNLQATPLYTGSAGALDVRYEPARGDATVLPVGGGFVETFAFGGGAPTLAGPTEATLTAPAAPWTLVAASGASSTVFGGMLEDVRPLAPLRGLEPRVQYWAPRQGATSDEFGLADGGILENFGLIPLLLRGVSRLAVFVNTSRPLSATYSPAKPPTAADLDEYLPPLFGLQVPSMGSFTTRNQVFPTADFAGVVTSLQAARRAGEAVVAFSEHELVPNAWWGLAGGRRVRVAWVYNERSPKWEAQLPPAVQSAIEAGNHAWLAHGPFERFPHYATTGENLLELVELTASQVNLLAALSGWVVTERGTELRELLGG